MQGADRDGWKVDAHRDALDPMDTTSTYRIPVNGVSEPLPDIAGHLDANVDTACPGGNLYNDLPSIRAEVKAVIDANAGTTSAAASGG